MICTKKKIVRYIPKFKDNDREENPVVVYIKVLSYVEREDFISTIKEKGGIRVSDQFRCMLDHVEGIYDEEGKEYRTADEVLDLPYISGLVDEIIEEMTRVNFTLEAEKK